MKKYFRGLCAVLSFVLTVSMVPIASATDISEYSENTKQLISETYGIPYDDVLTMSDDELARFAEDLDTVSVVSTTTEYWEFTEVDGEIIAEERSENDYLRYSNGYATQASNSGGSDWLSITTNIYSVNSTKGATSATYTWLTVPSFRLNDYAALTITKGVINQGSAWGNYKCVYNQNGTQKTYTYSFSSSDLTYGAGGNNRSVAAKKRLYVPDYPVVKDSFYLYYNFTKSGSSDGACASYAHQKLSINVSPSLTIPAGGAITITPALGFSTTSCYSSVNW